MFLDFYTDMRCRTGIFVAVDVDLQSLGAKALALAVVS